MKVVMDLVNRMDEELEDAKHYAEMYIELKAKGDAFNSKFKNLSEDELRHSTVIHDYAIDVIDQLENVFQPTVEMEEKWKTSHKQYVEKFAWIKKMLEM